MSASLTRCPSCARDTATTPDSRCEFCGQRKPVEAAPAPVTYGPPVPEPSLWDDMRPQIIAAGASVLIALVGIVAGSSLLLVLAAVVLVGSALSKILVDGW